MLRTQIYLTPSQLQQLKRYALEHDTTLSEVIRMMVDSGLYKTQKKPKGHRKNSGEWLLSLAKKAKRKKLSGPADLASNADKYLYGEN